MDKRIAPLGWNSWDCYGASVTEEIVRKNAAFMAEHLKQYGWEYIVVDIQWYEQTADSHQYHNYAELCMDEYSRLIPAVNRFPTSAGGKGFAPLAEYIHSLGLKFGIHIMRGIPRQAVHQNTPIKGSKATARQIAKQSSICMWNTDMYGINPEADGAREYYESLLELYASWGVDFIKCDDIANRFDSDETEIELFCDVVRDCKREMVLSLSPGPAPLEHAEKLKQWANMWRITDDFWDNWPQLYDMFERTEKWSIHTGAGNWPDADMLPIGPLRQFAEEYTSTRFTKNEQITMMTLWSIFRSPLFIGGEMTGFDEFTMKLITNPEIMKMHRNARHSHQVWRREINGTEYVLWVAASSEGGNYFALFNIGEQPGETELELSDLELDKEYDVKELWSKETYQKVTSITVALQSHEAKAFYVSES